MEVTSTTTATATSASETSALGLSDSFDTFLTLLTTQLTNQDPLEPLDSTEFTNQLVQYSEVEQSIATNQHLEDLLGMMRSDQLASSVGYLGAEVVMDGGTIQLTGVGAADIHYSLDTGAAAVIVEVQDELGRTVLTATGPSEAGDQTLTWDGRDANGNQLPQGLYQFTVTALDAEGQPLPVSTGISGTVEAVEFRGDQMLLLVDGILASLDSLTSIRMPDAA